MSGSGDHAADAPPSAAAPSGPLDEAARLLGEVDERPLAERVSAFERVDALLREALGQVDAPSAR